MSEIFRYLFAILSLLIFSKITVYLNDYGLSLSLVWFAFFLLPFILELIPGIIILVSWVILGVIGLPILPYSLVLNPLADPNTALILASIPTSATISLIMRFTKIMWLSCFCGLVLSYGIYLIWLGISKFQVFEVMFTQSIFFVLIPLLVSFVMLLFFYPIIKRIRKDS